MHIPEDVKAGEYTAMVGLYSPRGESGRRYPLLGDDASDRRYRVGKLTVSGSEAEITGLSFEPPSEPHQPDLRLVPNEEPTDFGGIVVSGALQVTRQGDRLLLTPLPEGEDLDVNLVPSRLLDHPVHARRRWWRWTRTAQPVAAPFRSSRRAKQSDSPFVGPNSGAS